MKKEAIRQVVLVRVLGALLLLVLWGTTHAQEEKRPPLHVPEVVNAAADFVPPGWRLEKEMLREEDLNGDGRPDAALVLTHGGNGPSVDAQFSKHVLVLALRGSDGKLHRSIVSDAAVLDGDEGGVFGDPFDGLMIERGAVVISHYGGSRDRWSYTHRYRYQNGGWMLIGLTLGSLDTLDPEHFNEQDINLSTGLVNGGEKGESVTEDGKKARNPKISGSYYELQALPVDQAPKIDGQFSSDEWPGYTVRLYDKRHVYRNAQLWRGVGDLSAQLHTVRIGDDLFLCAQVTDSDVTPGDSVRLATKKGQFIKPVESKLSRSGKGYVFEARYSLKGIGKLANPGDQYAGEELETYLTPDDFGDLSGFQLQLAVEVVDVDEAAAPKERSMMSTRVSGSPYNGAIRIFRKGTLVLVSDTEEQN